MYAGQAALFAADYLIEHREKLRGMTMQQEEDFERKRITNLEYPLAREWQRQQRFIKKLKSLDEKQLTRREFYQDNN